MVDAQDAADGCHEVEGIDWAFLDGGRLAVGATNDLAAANAAAHHDAGPGTRIVIAARQGATGVDPRRTTELAHPDDQGAIKHAAIAQVLDELAHGRINLTAERTDALEIVHVRIPAAEGDLDEADAGLNEAASQEAPFAELVAAISRANRRRLAADVERLRPLITHQRDGPLHRRAMGDGEAILMGAVEVVFQILEHAEAIVELIVLDERVEILDATARIVDDEGLMASAEEAGPVTAIGDRDVIRQRTFLPADLHASDGADRGINESTLAFAITSVEVVTSPTVRAFRGAHAADDGCVVGQLGELREVFANLDAGNGRADLAERSALIGARTKIEGVLMARAAFHPQEDAGLCPLPGLGSSAGQNRQPVGEREAADASGA